jgi:hypothetical protein
MPDYGNVRQLETVSWLQYPLPGRAAGALRGDERQHVDRSYMIRRPRDHRGRAPGEDDPDPAGPQQRPEQHRR